MGTHAPAVEMIASQSLVVDTAQRAERRRLLRLPAWIIFYKVDQRKKHVCIVRDMTRSGVFFYSDFRPNVGDVIEFLLKFPKWTKTAALALKGEVLRVEQPDPYAHPGIAVRLSRFVVWKGKRS